MSDPASRFSPSPMSPSRAHRGDPSNHSEWSYRYRANAVPVNPSCWLTGPMIVGESPPCGEVATGYSLYRFDRKKPSAFRGSTTMSAEQITIRGLRTVTSSCSLNVVYRPVPSPW